MNKTILITAGGKRIGAKLVSHLKGKGHRVIYTYNTSSCKDENCYQLDIADETAIAGFWDNLDIKVDILVNNAACFKSDTIKSIKAENFVEHINVNLKGPILMSQRFIEQKSGGIIINLLDSWAKTMPQNFLSYALSKNALEAFTFYLHHHYAHLVSAYGIELGFVLYNEQFPQSFFNAHKDLYPSSIEQLLSVVDFIISGGRISGDDGINGNIIDLNKWK
jgi:NAD(P)-dependent dehydrogenase (short-subunit alcohol dehydrogenase family)